MMHLSSFSVLIITIPLLLMTGFVGAVELSAARRSLSAASGPSPSPSPSPSSPFDAVCNLCVNLRNSLKRLFGFGEESPSARPTETPTREFDVPTEFYDIVIIGGGIAGLAAAAEIAATDPDLTYVIVESTDRIGGRVRSHTMGAPGREVVVEDGANWVYPFRNNPISNIATDISLENFVNNYLDITMFNETGQLVDQDLLQSRIDVFQDAFRRAGADADEQFTPDHESFPDQGVLKLLADNDWVVTDDPSSNLDYILQWLYVDFEYAVKDVSVRFFPYSDVTPNFVTDQRGFEAVIQEFQANNVPSDRIRFNHRVKTVNYDVSVPNEGTTYCARVQTKDEANDVQRDFYGLRVISTVSQGVLNSGDIAFTPPFTYPASEYNPFEMAQYIKVFYQFNNSFWNDTEFIEVMRNVPDRGVCHHWQNMEIFMPGSGLIRCELMTEAFTSLIDPDTKELTNATLSELLEPLRIAYGTETVGTPIDVYYPKLNLDADFGYGGYSYWKIGYSFTDFAKFYGGIEELTPYCDHNGCNEDGDWILHLSGSATCYRYSEYVHGGFFSGQRSAKFALESMGYDVRGSDNECDIYWDELTLRPTFLESLFGPIGGGEIDEEKKTLKLRTDGKPPGRGHSEYVWA